MSQLLTFSSFRNTGSRSFLRIPVWTQVPVSETVPVLFPLLAFLPLPARHPLFSLHAVPSAAQASLLLIFLPDSFPVTSVLHYPHCM